MTAPRFARISVGERRMPSRTSGCAIRDSISTNAASSAAAPTKESSVCAEPQPACGASTTAYTSRSIDPVAVIAPPTS